VSSRSRGRVVVVGAGVGGLAAAARLAAAGLAVTVLERAPVVGGKLGSVRHGAYVFDTGPSLLTLPAVFRQLFDATGGPLDEALELQAIDPGLTCHFADGVTVTLPGAGPAAVATRLGQAFGEEAGEQWRALMARAARIWALTREPVLGSPIAGVRDLLPLARQLSDIREVAPFTTLRGLGRRTLTDPHLRTLLDRYATYSGSDPRRAPAALVTVPYVESAFGMWHVAGGVHQLGLAVAARAAAAGAQVRTGTAVVEVLTGGGRVRAVRTGDGDVLPAEAVIVNADATCLYRDLLDPPGRRIAHAAVRRLQAAVPSFSGFSLLLALRGRTPGLGHHTVVFPADYDAEFAALFARRPVPVSDPTLYLCSPADPRMHPVDGEAVVVLVNAPRHAEPTADGQPPGTVNWRAAGVAEGYAERLLDLLAARGWPLRQRRLWWQWRSPADLADATGAPGGAIYGSASHGPRGAFLRAANRSPVPGLYLVGGSAHPGGGLPLVAMSAAIVSRLVRADLASGR